MTVDGSGVPHDTAEKLLKRIFQFNKKSDRHATYLRTSRPSMSNRSGSFGQTEWTIDDTIYDASIALLTDAFTLTIRFVPSIPARCIRQVTTKSLIELEQGEFSSFKLLPCALGASLGTKRYNPW
jgi:hypothetical protein